MTPSSSAAPVAAIVMPMPRSSAAHQGVALRVAALAGPSADAEDAVQEAFVKAYRSLRRFDEGRPFRPWLLAIVANEARSRGRSAQRAASLADRAAAFGVAAGESESAEESALARIGAGPLTAALGALRPDEQEVLVCRFVLDLGEEETAAALGVRRGTVKSRTSRALARLRTAPAGGSGMSEQELTLALRALGRRLDAEPVADVAPVVLARIAEEAPSRRRLRPLVLAFVALLLIAADGRRGVGRRCATGCADRASTSSGSRRCRRSRPRRRRRRRPPAVRTAPAASFAALGLGGGSTPRRPPTALGIPLPVSSELGPPAAIFSADTADGPAITLAWTPADPVLLTVVPAHDENDPFLIGKALTQASSVDTLTLPDGRTAVYISGAPHAVTMFDGRKVRVPARAGRAAVAPAGPRVFRLEGTFDQARAVALAASFDHAP